jgi:hypothetical protein
MLLFLFFRHLAQSHLFKAWMFIKDLATIANQSRAFIAYFIIMYNTWGKIAKEASQQNKKAYMECLVLLAPPPIGHYHILYIWILPEVHLE